MFYLKISYLTLEMIINNLIKNWVIDSQKTHIKNSKMNNNKEKVYKSKYQKWIFKHNKFKLTDVNKVSILNYSVITEKYLKVWINP